MGDMKKKKSVKVFIDNLVYYCSKNRKNYFTVLARNQITLKIKVLNRSRGTEEFHIYVR